MLPATGLGLLLALASACLVSWGYYAEHRAASTLPPLSARRPLRSVRLLLGDRAWRTGFGAESGGFGLYVLALALAPLALVQAVAAGGIGILALLVSKLDGVRLERRERIGVGLAVGGLALLAVSLAGGSEEGSGAAGGAVVAWLAGSIVLAAIAVGLGGAAPFGVAAGTLFAAGDVTTKVAVSGAGIAIFAVMIVFYLGGTALLQAGFQRGRALTTAGIATLATNALPIAAGMTIFAEPLPDGPLGVVRVLAFAAVVGGAFALAPARRGAHAQQPAADHGAELSAT